LISHGLHLCTDPSEASVVPLVADVSTLLRPDAAGEGTGGPATAGWACPRRHMGRRRAGPSPIKPGQFVVESFVASDNLCEFPPRQP
jgi:hypothetical protein